MAKTLIFSADHQLLATQFYDDESAVTIWEVSTGRKLYSFNLPEHLERDRDQRYDRLICFSPDGRLIVTQDGNTKAVSLWEHVSGRLRICLPASPQCNFGKISPAFSPDGRLLAIGYLSEKGERSIRIWDLVTRQEYQCFQGHETGGNSYKAPRPVFSPDGRRLASAGMDCTILIWDVQQPQVPGICQPLDQQELHVLRTALVGADASAAYRAMIKLRQVPVQAVAMAEECLRPRTDTFESIQVAQVVKHLIGDLDSDDFQTRMKAFAELRQMLNDESGESVIQSMLNETLSREKLSVEVNKAIIRLLDEQKEEQKWGGARSPELTRMFRAIEVLESIHNDTACEVLQKMIATPPRPEVRREAEAALKRLAALSHGSHSIRP